MHARILRPHHGDRNTKHNRRVLDAPQSTPSARLQGAFARGHRWRELPVRARAGTNHARRAIVVAHHVNAVAEHPSGRDARCRPLDRACSSIAEPREMRVSPLSNKKLVRDLVTEIAPPAERFGAKEKK